MIPARKISEYTVVLAISAALTVLFFKDVIFSNNLLCFRDLGRFFYPPREYAFTLIKHGVMPLWNPFIYCGNPLLASHQPAVLYPVSLVYLIGDFARAFNNFIYIHFVLASVFMYIFLRDRKIPGTASFLGAVTFAFSGYMLATVNVLTFFSSGIWLPLVLWAFFRAQAASGRERRIYVVLTSVFLLCIFLAGEPMILYMTAFILLLFGGLKDIRLIFSVFAIFFFLGAFQILPVAELLLRSDRMKMVYEVAAKWSAAPHDFLNLIFPCVTDVENYFKGYWERQSWLLDYYMGLFPLLMIPIAVFLAKEKRKPAILFMLLLSVVLALGKHTPVYHLLFKFLPGFNLFRYPVKYFYITAFSMAWLTAIGYGYYENNIKTDGAFVRRVRYLLYIALAAGLLLLAVDIFFVDIAKFIHQHFFSSLEKALKKDSTSESSIMLGVFTVRRSLIFFVVFALALFYGAKKRFAAKALSLTVTAIVLCDLYSAAYDLNFSCDIARVKKPSPNIEFLMKDKSLFRILSSPSNTFFLSNPNKETYKDVIEVGKERLFSNRMMEYGLYDVGGYEAALGNRMSDMILFLSRGLKSPDDSRILDALNVKYVVSPKTFEARGYLLAKGSDIANIYENRNVLPRAFLSARAVVLNKREAIFGKFQDKKWDPEEEVVLEEAPPGIADGGERRTNGESAAIIKYSPNEVIVKAVVEHPRFLVLSDSYYPGWKVYIDGKPGKIYIANYVSRAVYLNAGEHAVRFVFDPFSFRLGLAITLFAAIFIAVRLSVKFPETDAAKH
ncbi:MAG: YfhO family protein [Candidatus Omnitrophica bacterium]|nr:YfhO family protein [Candidatus Omnitrophota bacterium]